MFFIELSSRRVHTAGITPQPHSSWIKQITRNVTDPVDGFRPDTGYLVMDRDTIFREEFLTYLEREDVKSVRLPPRSPNLNDSAEESVGTIRESCLDRRIFFGERSRWNAINEFMEFHHQERNHQGLGNRLIDPPEEFGAIEGCVACRERLGGVLRNYYRKAA